MISAAETFELLAARYGPAMAEEIAKVAPGGLLPEPRQLARLVARRKFRAIAAKGFSREEARALPGAVGVPARTLRRWLAERPRKRPRGMSNDRGTRAQ